jgi:bifunctional non-homologous end joining protein LigD
MQELEQEQQDIKSNNLQTKNKNNFSIQTKNVTSTYNFNDIKDDTQCEKLSIRSAGKQSTSSRSQQQSSFNNNYNFSNLDKIYWQGSKTHPPITKRDLIEYYDKINLYILPHLRNRPLSLNRYPDGPKGKSFYQKNWQSEKPDYVNSVNIYSESKGESINYLLCNNKETLLWIANLGGIEIHPWYNRVKDLQDFNHLKVDKSDLNYPDFIVFDLDPYIYSGNEGGHQEPEYNLKAFKSTVEVAFCLKNIFDKIKIKSFIKTSGKTGLHIFIPIINLYTYEQTRSFAKITGRILNKLLPSKITMEWNTTRRKDKIFYDYNQNAIGKTLSSVYSVRPTESATVSMPIEWDELTNIIPTDFTIINVPEILKIKGDPWKNINEQKQEIDKILDKVSDLAI